MSAAMQTRPIGSLMASVAGLGCNNFGMKIDAGAALLVVDAALDCGVNFFDTADVYGSAYGQSEQILGDALGSRIGRAIVATKFGAASKGAAGGASPAYIRQALDGSLSRLGTDHVDLYQLHMFDPATPVDETIGCLHELVGEGKVREVGVSNCNASQLGAMLDAAHRVGLSLVSLQNHYNLLHQDDASQGLGACTGTGVGYLPYFPLASGMLTGKYVFGEPPPEGSRVAVLGNDNLGGVVNARSQAIVTDLQAWAADHGHSVADAAIGWLLADQRIPSVIAGATTPAQVQSNSASASWVLTDEDVAAVNAIVAAHPPAA
ncbi:MAG: aldo/keto reductase [Ilumatobacteraceae bacterium]|nr:aldo/keto reductase [Ilumatobacteraceae bacterium]